MTAIDTRYAQVGPSFAGALWGTGLGLRVLMGFAFLSIFLVDPLPLWLVAIAVMIDLLVFATQSTRYAGASTRYLTETGKFWSVCAGWFGFGLSACAMIAIWAVGYMRADYTPSEVAKVDLPAVIESRGPLPRYRTSISYDGRELTFEGIIVEGAMKKIGPLIEATPSLEQINLNSAGGNLYEARMLARQIIRSNLRTHVAVECSGSCLLAFMASPDRTLGSGASLGFHLYGLDFLQLMTVIDIEHEREYDRRYLRERNVTETFLNRYFDPSRQALWFPSRTVLVQEQVLPNEE